MHALTITTSSFNSSSVQVPDDGVDLRNAASVEAPFQNLFNNEMYLLNLFNSQNFIQSGLFVGCADTITIDVAPIQTMVISGTVVSSDTTSLIASDFDGTMSDSTWYFIYIKLVSGNPVFYLSDVAPTNGNSRPGLPNDLFVQSVFHTTSNQFRPFYRNGQLTTWVNGPATIFSSASISSTNAATLNLYTVIPPHCRQAIINVQHSITASSNSTNIAVGYPNSSFLDASTVQFAENVLVPSAGGSIFPIDVNFQINADCIVTTNSTPQIKWCATVNNGGTVSFFSKGYLEIN